MNLTEALILFSKCPMLAAFEDCFSNLDGEAASASAASGGVRVVELEASFVDSVQVVDHGSLHERSEFAVHHDFDSVLVGSDVVFFVDLGVEAQRVFEAAAATGSDDDSQNGSVWNVLFDDESFDLGRCFFGQTNWRVRGGRIGDILRWCFELLKRLRWSLCGWGSSV